MDEHLDPSIMTDFIMECKEHLESVEGNLITLENNPDDLEILNTIFRAVHSVKGGASFLGLKRLTHLTHRMENVLDDLRKEKIPVSSEIIDAVLEGLDVLIQLIEEMSNNIEEAFAQDPENLPDFDDLSEIEVEEMAKKFELLKEQAGKPPEKIQEIEPTQRQETEKKVQPPEHQQQIQPENNTVPDNNDAAITPALNEALSIFLNEAVEIFERVSRHLIELEKNNTDPELLNSLFREIHNFKGNARYLGFANTEKLAHNTESVLDDVRKGTLEVTSDLIDLLFQCVDTFNELLKGIAENGNDTFLQADDLIAQLQNFLAPSDKKKSDLSNQPKKEKKSSGDETVAIFITATSQHITNIKTISAKIKDNSADKLDYDVIIRAFDGLKSSANYMGFDEIKTLSESMLTLTQKLRTELPDHSCPTIADLLGRVIEYYDSSIESIKNSGKEQEVDLLLTADVLIENNKLSSNKPVSDTPKDKTKQEADSQEPQKPTSSQSKTPVKDNVVEEKNKERKKTDIQNNQDTKPAVESKPVQKSQTPKSRKTVPMNPQQKKKVIIESTIRVEQSKLDILMNLIGELIINRNRFGSISKRLELDYNLPTISKDLKQATYMIGRISDDLQSTIMEARMIPVGIVFNKMPRLVRDLAKTKGKEISLNIVGEDTELDKSVIEQIGDPLVHLIRNSADHGLESTEERIKAGKSKVGNIYLRALHQGNSVIIEVEDDGAGIHADKIKKIALKKGVINETEYETMNEDNAINLIFAPGFSTVEQVSNISGRGVGMDVVRDNISKLNGRINVKTEVGKGTKFSLILPLTLAIVDTIMVRVEANIFAIPLSAVSETVKINKNEIKYLKKRKSINLRNTVIGIENLSDVIGIDKLKLSSGDIQDAQNTNEEDILSMVIINCGTKSVGLIVDELLDKQEVVIKPLVDFLACIRGISGASILGDGSIVLIVEPAELINLATEKEVK
ncbi:chemotaxis protein CheA [bacterium]|nr:chemotaxis protein CheA [bacterium]